MPQWDLFAGVAVLAVAGMLVLARLSQGTLAGEEAIDADRPNDAVPAGSPFDSTGLLFANVVFSHGLLGGALLAIAWYAGIPAAALGLDGSPTQGVLVGTGLGVALYVVGELAARVADRWGVERDERLRELLAPATLRGWVVLLAGALPIVAGVEELLFRGALVGALAAGYGLSPWLLAVGSSILFGLGHGLQGPGGVVVTAGLGFVLAAAFVVTGSLVAVVVAHYVVNALEFVVHEGLDR